jgi:pyruvate/2-oxoglutarate dehydrogenase complex dihydrolipoamide acyltransferase (E2) component
MPTVSIRIPQMGEGLQEALLVQFLKKPGDMVRRDEALYVMETDKATTDVESPYAGRLVEWLVKEGTVLAIGTEVATMEIEASVPSVGIGHVTQDKAMQAKDESSEEDSREEGSAWIPPRTRKLLKEKG